MVVLQDFAGVDAPMAGHAEMENQGIAAIGVDQAVFRTAMQAGDACAGEPLTEVHWERAP
jgi:hypothetical protein